MIPLDHKAIFLFWQKSDVAIFPIYLPIANCYDFHKFKISKNLAISLEFFPTTSILIYLFFPIVFEKWEFSF